MKSIGKEVIIFGGTGYIGSHLALKLFQKGFQVLLAESQLFYNEFNLNGLKQLCGESINAKVFDWNNQIEIENFLNSKNKSSLIVFAGYQYYHHQFEKSLFKSKAYHLENAIKIFKSIFEDRNRSTILLSSHRVYGKSKKIELKEDFKLLKGNSEDLNLNALTEQLFSLNKENQNLIIARLGEPIGVHSSLKIGPNPKFHLSPFHQQISESIYDKEEFPVLFRRIGNEKKFKSLDLIHILDATEAIALIIQKAFQGKLGTKPIYNISTNQTFPYNNIGKALTFFSQNKITTTEKEMNQDDNLVTNLSNKRIVAELGWSAKLSFIDALQSHLNFLHQQQNLNRKAA